MATISEIKDELLEMQKKFKYLVDEFESKGTEDMDRDQIEYYGAYLGKLDLCDYLLKKIG